MTNKFIDFINGMGLVIFVFMLIVVLTVAGHCTVSTTNSLGVVISDIDLNVALVGTIMSGEVKQDADGREATAIRVHPQYMYSLYDEGLLFCGYQGDRLTENGAMLAGVWAFTYRRAASRLIDGVPCHELIGIDKVVEKRKL